MFSLSLNSPAVVLSFNYLLSLFHFLFFPEPYSNHSPVQCETSQSSKVNFFSPLRIAPEAAALNLVECWPADIPGMLEPAAAVAGHQRDNLAGWLARPLEWSSSSSTSAAAGTEVSPAAGKEIASQNCQIWRPRWPLNVLFCSFLFASFACLISLLLSIWKHRSAVTKE